MITRLAASNIAWEPGEDDAVAVILRQYGFTGVEIAPGKRWESPIDATRKEISAYRAEWEQRGLQIVAMQALLFGRPDLQLFGSGTVRRALREYLTALIEMAEGLGVGALVFGSPKNRKRGKMPLDEATAIAVEFFRELGAIAASKGTVICIEPNPPAYDCDFINTTDEAASLCDAIASRGVRVNGDIGALTTESDFASVVRRNVQRFGHVHASELGLAEVTGSPHQQAAATALKSAGYSGWVSVEMRADAVDRVGALARAADRVSTLYAG